MVHQSVKNLGFHEIEEVKSGRLTVAAAAIRKGFRGNSRMLWVDKYRPVQLDRLSYHDDLTAQLRRMACKENVGNMSHLMFYGPSGAGKKTRVMALLREASPEHPLHTSCVCPCDLPFVSDLWCRS